MALDRRLQSIGLPDDLSAIALRDAPAPDAAAQARIRVRVLRSVQGTPQPRSLRWRRTWPWAAAAAVAALALATPAGSGFMHGLLRFVPGFGLQQPAVGERALAHTVRVQAAGDTVYVTGVLANRAGTQVLFSIVGPDVQLSTSDVRLLDARGRVYHSSGSSWAFGLGSEDVGTGGFEFPALQAGTGSVTLVLPLQPVVRVRLPLVAASSLPAAAKLPSARVHGVTLAVQAARHGGEALFTVLAKRTPQGTLAQGYGQWNQPLLLSGAGRSITLHSVPGFGGPIQNYSAPALPAGVQTARVVVPSVNLSVQDTASVNVPVPPKGSLALRTSLVVGPAQVLITKVQRLAHNRIRLTLSSFGPAALADPGFFSVNGQTPGAMQWTLSRGGAMRTMTFSVPAQDWWVSLTMATPQVIVQGPWRVMVPLASR